MLKYEEINSEAVPTGWNFDRLGNLCTTSSGTTPSRSNEERYYRNGTIYWVKTADLTNAKISTTEELVTKIALDETSLKVYPVGTVLIAMYGGFNQIGRTGLLKVPAAVNQAITAIQTKPKLIISEYLLNVLNYHVNYWKTVASSSRKDPNITSNDIKQFPVCFPTSKKEQQAIATALSDVDALITSLDKLIAKKRAIKQATMQQLLTGKRRLPGFSGEWNTRKFEKIFQFLNTANNSRSDLSENGEIKYIHYGDIHMKWRSFLDCSSDELPLIQKNKLGNVPFLEDGDLVMVDASEDYDGIGISVEVKNTAGQKVVAGLHTFLLRGDKDVLADGFKGYLQYIPTVKDSFKKAATGISVYGISKNTVRKISISLPDIEEQQAIATVLADMDAEIVALEQRRDKTRALKQGMMQELLTGKTRLL